MDSGQASTLPWYKFNICEIQMMLVTVTLFYWFSPLRNDQTAEDPDGWYGSDWHEHHIHQAPKLDIIRNWTTFWCDITSTTHQIRMLIKISVASRLRLIVSIQANCCWLHHALYEHRFCIVKTLLTNNGDDEDIDDDNSDDESDNVDYCTGVGILFKKDKPAPNNLFSFLQVAINHFCHKPVNSSQTEIW